MRLKWAFGCPVPTVLDGKREKPPTLSVLTARAWFLEELDPPGPLLLSPAYSVLSGKQ